MSGIEMDHAAARRLLDRLQERYRHPDGKRIKRTDLVEDLGATFGRKGDALMHQLKSTATAQAPAASVADEVVELALVDIGRKAERVRAFLVPEGPRSKEKRWRLRFTRPSTQETWQLPAMMALSAAASMPTAALRDLWEEAVPVEGDARRRRGRGDPADGWPGYGGRAIDPSLLPSNADDLAAAAGLARRERDDLLPTFDTCIDGFGDEVFVVLRCVHRPGAFPHRGWCVQVTHGSADAELPDLLTFEEAVRAAPRTLFGKGNDAVIGDFTLEEAAKAVGESWNAPFAWLQVRMGVETGDVAGYFWNGSETEGGVLATLQSLPPALWSRLPNVPYEIDEETVSARTPFDVDGDDIRAVSRRFADTFARSVGMEEESTGIDKLARQCEIVMDRYVDFERAYWEPNSAIPGQ